jgi:hypothetical protein
MTINDDSLDSLIREADPAMGLTVSAPEQLAELVRSRYAGIKRRRTYARNIAGATVCYAIGVLTMWLWMQSPPQSEAEREMHPVTSATEPVMPDSVAHVSEAPDSNRGGEHPEVATLAIPVESRYEALRALGDRYLLQQGKVDLAVDVYARALDEATQAESAISYEHDSWLLISLKRDRLLSSL